MVTVVLADDALAVVLAMAPVTARARTRQRTMIFMVWLPLVTCSGRKNYFLDNVYITTIEPILE
jgi:hypothetical protein